MTVDASKSGNSLAPNRRVPLVGESDIAVMAALNPGRFSAAYLALWLLFGLFFAMIVTHFLRIDWSPVFTRLVFGTGLLGTVLLTWLKRDQLGAITHIDRLFMAFLLLVVGSLAFRGGYAEASGKYLRYLPFLVVTPYLAGRLMRSDDIIRLARWIVVAGLLVLPLLAIDRIMAPESWTGRWPFFGQPNGVLMAGELLAPSLIALCLFTLYEFGASKPGRTWRMTLYWSLTVLVSAVLVWLTARGWLLAGVIGATSVCLFARSRCWQNFVLPGSILVCVAVTIPMVQRIDPNSGNHYAASQILPSGSRPHATPVQLILPPVSRAPVIVVRPVKPISGPILGANSCRPFIENTNSVAIRRVLYREAIAMFASHPLAGVGAARFGERSCAGPGWYPHSTLLQAFSELGIFGGGILLLLLTSAAMSLVRTRADPGCHFGRRSSLFVLGLFVTFIIADQIYGNYFMSVGTYLVLGMVSRRVSLFKKIA